MSIQTQIDRLASAKAAIKTAIESKDVSVPADTLLSGMASLIESIETGGGIDISPFTSVKSGTFTIASDVHEISIEGVSNCKIFALRALNNNGIYYENHGLSIVAAILVNTETYDSYKGASIIYNNRALMSQALSKFKPTISGDVLTFGEEYYLDGTYEYIMVSK